MRLVNREVVLSEPQVSCAKMTQNSQDSQVAFLQCKCICLCKHKTFIQNTRRRVLGKYVALQKVNMLSLLTLAIFFLFEITFEITFSPETQMRQTEVDSVCRMLRRNCFSFAFARGVFPQVSNFNKLCCDFSILPKSPSQLLSGTFTPLRREPNSLV